MSINDDNDDVSEEEKEVRNLPSDRSVARAPKRDVSAREEESNDDEKVFPDVCVRKIMRQNPRANQASNPSTPSLGVSSAYR